MRIFRCAFFTSSHFWRWQKLLVLRQKGKIEHWKSRETPTNQMFSWSVFHSNVTDFGWRFDVPMIAKAVENYFTLCLKQANHHFTRLKIEDPRHLQGDWLSWRHRSKTLSMLPKVRVLLNSCYITRLTLRSSIRCLSCNFLNKFNVGSTQTQTISCPGHDTTCPVCLPEELHHLLQKLHLSFFESWRADKQCAQPIKKDSAASTPHLDFLFYLKGCGVHGWVDWTEQTFRSPKFSLCVWDTVGAGVGSPKLFPVQVCPI